MNARVVVWLSLALTQPGMCQPLPGTAALTSDSDLAMQMVDGINTWLLRETAEAQEKRSAAGWKSDAEAVARLRRIIGAVDLRVKRPDGMNLVATTNRTSVIARGRRYRVHEVRWEVFDGVHGVGLLLEPENPPVARIVAVPDADWSPEMLVGLTPGVDAVSQAARRLAESGCLVVVPVLIDRKDTWSGIPDIRMTNLPHREWIYRMAFETGRHIIGYEVQKVLSAIDYFEHENIKLDVPIGVVGYGEGGLIALHAAAIDGRIDTTLISGHFQSREDVWKEPIYRDVWGLLREFGDAELAAMIAPRALTIEAAKGPLVVPPPATDKRRGATPNGALNTPPLASVRSEVNRARRWFADRNAADKLHLVLSGDGAGPPHSENALESLLRLGGVKARLRPAGAAPEPVRPPSDPVTRMQSQFEELVAWTQKLVRASARKREQFWSDADTSSPERWNESTKRHRDYLWTEVIGRMPAPTVPANPRSRLIFDEPKFRGYEVVLDVWAGVIATGILLVPKDLKPGERRPIVVCQHGLEGRPRDLSDPAVDHPAYHRYAVRLAEEGFVTYSPQNPYIGQDRFRLIQRKAHPLKLALFSFILGQHQRTLEWLGGLPFIDPQRIGFYGLSYGGKTAVRVPPLLDQYALSICSADFNEWVWKNTSVDSRYSYLLTGEYDMIEFDFANVANYSDLANLMAPRPFMVERGHRDGVAPDEWVAYEFAKVRRFYGSVMKMPERAEIEFFDGPHTIHGSGTFRFLRRHLRWPN
jgi:dienelactone hydrolase